MELANRLSQLRKEKGLTQQALAELTGTHPNVIGKYELGLAIPSVDMAGKLAHALNVSIDYLAGNDDIIVDNRLMDKIKSLLKLPEDVKNSVMYSLDKLIGKAKGSIA